MADRLYINVYFGVMLKEIIPIQGAENSCATKKGPETE
jgi:hypothetical protein